MVDRTSIFVIILFIVLYLAFSLAAAYDACKKLINFKEYKQQAIITTFNFAILMFGYYKLSDTMNLYVPSVFNDTTYAITVIILIVSGLIIALTRHRHGK